MYQEKLSNLYSSLFLPYKFGFVLGHTYLTNQQILKMREILYSHGNQEILDEYETKMVNLIGSAGYGISFAAGRMAFYSILQALNIRYGDEVILFGFASVEAMAHQLRVVATNTGGIPEVVVNA
ncbi:MAG: hypothetical protein NT096_02100 [Proteobacteria bacterium]|nr:hypothetical protein [Pseudomonadota bacterium]